MALLNETLAEKQEITEEQRENLDKLYDELKDLLKKSKTLNESNQLTKDAAQKLVSDVRDIEFKLQENWNFPKDPLCHTWWNRLSGCTCPELDNSERFGLPKIHMSSCPYHGFEINLIKESK